MAQQGKGKGFAVVLSLVAIAGVVGYLIYRKYKNKPKGTDSATTPEFTPAPTSTGGGSTGGGSTGGGSTGGGSTSSGNPFATQNDLLKFQRWVIITKGDKTILGKGGSTGFGDDGSWGSKSASAWAKYQSPYDPAKVNDDGTMKGGTTSNTSTLKKVITTDYVNFYKTPSSFIPLNVLPYKPNEILGTSDGKEYYDGNTPYYLVNVAPSIVNSGNYSGVGQSGIPTSYVKARAVKLT